MPDQSGDNILYIISFQTDGKSDKVSVYARGLNVCIVVLYTSQEVIRLILGDSSTEVELEKKI